MHIRPKNWGEFQHYKDRSPPWIKLHKGLLDDYDFQCLPVASRALAPMLWLLASEDAAGLIDAEPKKLAFRFRITLEEVEQALKPLIDGAFFLVLHPDSNPLAKLGRDARPETETEAQEQAEGESLSAKADGVRAPALPVGKITEQSEFEQFITAYSPPKNWKRPDTLKAWKASAGKRPEIDVLLRAVAGYRAWLAEQSRKQKREYPQQHPATWLRGEVWAQFVTDGAGQQDATAARAAWDGKAALLIDALGDNGVTLFAAWFTGANFAPGPPARIGLPNTGRRTQIENRFREPLRKAFGEVILEVAA